MKKIFFLLIILLSFKLYSQDYSDVIEIQNKNSTQLYNDALEWFALTFKSSNDVIQLKDPEEKKIIGKALKKIGYYIKKTYVPMDMYFTLSVQFKDNRYKYMIQSNDIISSGGEKYTYEIIKNNTTVEGLTSYYKSTHVSPLVVGEKQIKKYTEYNKTLLDTIDAQLINIINDLTETLNKKNNTDNW